ncbi:hypothetical protein EMIT0P4_120097 [Pseudomonas sp. IT-P4]
MIDLLLIIIDFAHSSPSALNMRRGRLAKGFTGGASNGRFEYSQSAFEEADLPHHV